MLNLPSLLIATEFPPNASGGGPAVIRQYLASYPAEQLYWWSAWPELNQKFGRKVADHRVARLPEKLYPYQRATKLKSFILENFWSPWAAQHLRETIRIFKPEAIWVIPHNWSIPPLANALLGAKQPFHVSMQDYVDVHGHPQRFGVERCQRMAEQADQLYTQAATRDAICDPMIEDLKKRTGAQANQILRAGLEAEDFALLEQKRDVLQDKIRIAYAGSILVPEVFEFFVKALDLARKNLNKPCVLELFGAHAFRDAHWFDPSWMNERGNLTEPELKKALRECHCGFVPMSLRDDEPRYNRFSFPTKYASYLATGLPTIVLGHETAAVVKTARTYNTGFWSGTEHLEELAGELKTFLQEKDLGEKFRTAVTACARKEFDATAMRGRLFDYFGRLASAC